uniref:Osteopetrosis-associated transmembrane protein 1 n=1 Tax=Lygus hesperus TaxID=30085 RepID=A0A0A9WZ00_LYGHE
MAFWTPSILLFVCCLPFLTADDIDGFVQDDTCMNMLKDFANSSAAFTFCAVSHARPILICQECVSSYLEVVEVYDDITKLESTAGHKCESELVNLDRLQVFNQGYNYIKTLWKNALCDNCFIKDRATGNPTIQLTDLVVEILNASTVYGECVKKYRNATAKPDLLVCEKCIDSYKNINDIYVKNKGSVELCMDVVDLMNNTRNEWSDDIGCCKDRRKPEMTLILTATGVGVLPFIFYLLTYFLTTKKVHAVIERKRWNGASNGASKSPDIQVSPPENT